MIKRLLKLLGVEFETKVVTEDMLEYCEVHNVYKEIWGVTNRGVKYLPCPVCKKEKNSSKLPIVKSEKVV